MKGCVAYVMMSPQHLVLGYGRSWKRTIYPIHAIEYMKQVHFCKRYQVQTLAVCGVGHHFGSSA